MFSKLICFVPHLHLVPSYVPSYIPIVQDIIFLDFWFSIIVFNSHPFASKWSKIGTIQEDEQG